MIYLFLGTVVICITLILFVLIDACSQKEIWIFKKDINSKEFDYLLNKIKILEERMDKLK